MRRFGNLCLYYDYYKGRSNLVWLVESTSFRLTLKDLSLHVHMTWQVLPKHTIWYTRYDWSLLSVKGDSAHLFRFQIDFKMKATLSTIRDWMNLHIFINYFDYTAYISHLSHPTIHFSLHAPLSISLILSTYTDDSGTLTIHPFILSIHSDTVNTETLIIHLH